jgi:hypothetical protein
MMSGLAEPSVPIVINKRPVAVAIKSSRGPLCPRGRAVVGLPRLLAHVPSDPRSVARCVALP